MKRFDFRDCMMEGLLRNIPPSAEKAEGSFGASDKWLAEAGKCLESGTFNSSAIASYLAMFHAARAILFFDGFREKSHYCLARYLEEKCVKTGALERKWVDVLDHFRELRHESQYDISFFTSEEEAESALKAASGFVGRMESLLAGMKAAKNRAGP